MSEKQPALRLDKWLWHARFFKSRGLAGDLAGSGALRINAERVDKPAVKVKPGDVLTFAQSRVIRVIRIEALADRRGPAPEAQGLYEDMSPPPPPKNAADGDGALALDGSVARREPGAGRPTKRERRDTDRLRGDIDG